MVNYEPRISSALLWLYHNLASLWRFFSGGGGGGLAAKSRDERRGGESKKIL